MDYFSLVLPQKNTSFYEQTQRYFIQKHVIEALEKALEKPTHAAPILQKYFRQKRSLGSKIEEELQTSYIPSFDALISSMLSIIQHHSNGFLSIKNA